HEPHGGPRMRFHLTSLARENCLVAWCSQQLVIRDMPGEVRLSSAFMVRTCIPSLLSCARRMGAPHGCMELLYHPEVKEALCTLIPAVGFLAGCLAQRGRAQRFWNARQ